MSLLLRVAVTGLVGNAHTTRRTLVSYTTNIPKCIPNGEYLLRIQSLGIHNPGSTPQFYVSCAQVNVVGGGSTTPQKTTQIPGFIKATDPGYTANVSQCPTVGDII